MARTKQTARLSTGGETAEQKKRRLEAEKKREAAAKRSAMRKKKEEEKAAAAAAAAVPSGIVAEKKEELKKTRTVKSLAETGEDVKAQSARIRKLNQDLRDMQAGYDMNPTEPKMIAINSKKSAIEGATRVLQDKMTIYRNKAKKQGIDETSIDDNLRKIIKSATAADVKSKVPKARTAREKAGVSTTTTSSSSSAAQPTFLDFSSSSKIACFELEKVDTTNLNNPEMINNLTLVKSTSDDMKDKENVDEYHDKVIACAKNGVYGVSDSSYNKLSEIVDNLCHLYPKAIGSHISGYDRWERFSHEEIDDNAASVTLYARSGGRGDGTNTKGPQRKNFHGMASVKRVALKKDDPRLPRYKEIFKKGYVPYYELEKAGILFHNKAYVVVYVETTSWEIFVHVNFYSAGFDPETLESALMNENKSEDVRLEYFKQFNQMTDKLIGMDFFCENINFMNTLTTYNSETKERSVKLLMDYNLLCYHPSMTSFRTEGVALDHNKQMHFFKALQSLKTLMELFNVMNKKKELFAESSGAFFKVYAENNYFAADDEEMRLEFIKLVWNNMVMPPTRIGKFDQTRHRYYMEMMIRLHRAAIKFGGSGDASGFPFDARTKRMRLTNLSESELQDIQNYMMMVIMGIVTQGYADVYADEKVVEAMENMDITEPEPEREPTPPPVTPSVTYNEFGEAPDGTTFDTNYDWDSDQEFPESEEEEEGADGFYGGQEELQNQLVAERDGEYIANAGAEEEYDGDVMDYKFTRLQEALTEEIEPGETNPVFFSWLEEYHGITATSYSEVRADIRAEVEKFALDKGWDLPDGWNDDSSEDNDEKAQSAIDYVTDTLEEEGGLVEEDLIRNLDEAGMTVDELDEMLKKYHAMGYYQEEYKRETTAYNAFRYYKDHGYYAKLAEDSPEFHEVAEERIDTDPEFEENEYDSDSDDEGPFPDREEQKLAFSALKAMKSSKDSDGNFDYEKFGAAIKQMQEVYGDLEGPISNLTRYEGVQSVITLEESREFVRRYRWYRYKVLGEKDPDASSDEEGVAVDDASIDSF